MWTSSKAFMSDAEELLETIGMYMESKKEEGPKAPSTIYPFLPKPSQPKQSVKTELAKTQNESTDAELQPNSPVEAKATRNMLSVPGVIELDGNSSASNMSSFRDMRGRSDSKLSFIMKERLHSFAADLQRRTTAIRSEIERPTTPLEDEDSSSLLTAAPPPTHNLEDENMDSVSYEGLPLSHRIIGWILNLRIPNAIDTQSGGYLAWLVLVSFAFLYNAYGIPLRSSYPYQTPTNVWVWVLLDAVCDIIYVVDMALVKPRLIYTKGGLAIDDRNLLLRHYLFSVDFKLDLLALLPLEIFYIRYGVKSFLRLPRLLKVKAYSSSFELMDNMVSNVVILRISKTLSYMIYIIHVNSCIYYVFSSWQAFGIVGYVVDGEFQENDWVYQNMVIVSILSGTAYIRCFYFTTKLATSIGNNPAPTNVIEYVYVTASWLMGVFVFAVLLGQIRDIVATASRNQEEFRKAMDSTLSHCALLRLPEELQERVRRWFIYTWQEQKTLDETSLISKLPLKLQTDLAISVHLETLNKVQLFQDCEAGLLRELVLKLRPVLFLPGDLVCKKGEVGKEMYIISKGVVEVVGGPGGNTVFVTLKEGSVFGEVSLLSAAGSNKRTADVRSAGFSNLFVLSKEDLFSVIVDYPIAQKILKRKARALVKKAEERDGKTGSKDLSSLVSVTSQIKSPKMLSAVISIMDPDSDVTKQLKSVTYTSAWINTLE